MDMVINDETVKIIVSAISGGGIAAIVFAFLRFLDGRNRNEGKQIDFNSQMLTYFSRNNDLIQELTGVVRHGNAVDIEQTAAIRALNSSVDVAHKTTDAALQSQAESIWAMRQEIGKLPDQLRGSLMPIAKKLESVSLSIDSLRAEVTSTRQEMITIIRGGAISGGRDNRD